MSLTYIGIVGISIAFVLNHIISQINPFILQFINLYSIPVIYIAMKKFNPSSILLTATAGVLEDLNSFLPIGVNALKKLILIFVVNRVSNYISISSFIGYLTIIFLSVIFELCLLALITTFFGLKNPLGALNELLILQPLITSIVGAPFFIFFSKISKRGSI